MDSVGWRLEAKLSMIPAGYMAKRVALRPEWLNAPGVKDIYSLSRCTSENFGHYIPFWRHNGFWLFDEPAIIKEIAVENHLELRDCTVFYYEAHHQQYDLKVKQWVDYDPQRDFPVRVKPPADARLEGYDVVTFSCQTSAECSPLSCNYCAASIATNEHCLLNSFEEAVHLLESGRFDDTEPGPFRIFSVYSV